MCTIMYLTEVTFKIAIRCVAHINCHAYSMRPQVNDLCLSVPTRAEWECGWSCTAHMQLINVQRYMWSRPISTDPLGKIPTKIPTANQGFLPHRPQVCKWGISLIGTLYGAPLYLTGLGNTAGERQATPLELMPELMLQKWRHVKYLKLCCFGCCRSQEGTEKDELKLQGK